jgi:hypothetical protein
MAAFDDAKNNISFPRSRIGCLSRRPKAALAEIAQLLLQKS